VPAAAAVQLAETFVDFDDIIENYDGERPSTIAYRRTKSKIRQYLRRSIAILSYRTICSGTHSVRAYDGSPIIKGHRRREYRVPGRHTSLRRLAYFPRNARPPPNFGTYSYCRNSRTIRGMGFRVSSPVTVFVPNVIFSSAPSVHYYHYSHSVTRDDGLLEIERKILPGRNARNVDFFAIRAFASACQRTYRIRHDATVFFSEAFPFFL